MQCRVTGQKEQEIKEDREQRFGGRRRRVGGREGDEERDIWLPARAKIISPGLARRSVRAD